MAIGPEILGLVLACALVTAVPRVLPLLVLSRLNLPAWLLDWLRYVPVAVLASLLSLEVYNKGTAGLLATIVPPWASVSSRTIDRPMPSPPA